MADNFEVEVKYAVDSHAEVRRRIESLGGAFADQELQEDTYFAHPERDFAATDEALRIRQRRGRPAVITYKGPKVDAETKTRRELEIPLQDPAAHARLLLLLGFREVASVRKRRQTAELRIEGRGVEICLDEVERLGSFVELETAADAADLDRARGVLLRLAERLGLARGERRGYLDLLLAR